MTDETNPTWQAIMDAAADHRRDGGIAVFFSREECADLTPYERMVVQDWLVEQGNGAIDALQRDRHDQLQQTIEVPRPGDAGRRDEGQD